MICAVSAIIDQQYYKRIKALPPHTHPKKKASSIHVDGQKRENNTRIALARTDPFDWFQRRGNRNTRQRITHTHIYISIQNKEIKKKPNQKIKRI